MGLAAVCALRAAPIDAGQTRAAAKDCFPFESLPGPLRERAETLLLSALDGEGLYTMRRTSSR
jgi:hypothetical protein